MYAQLLVTGLWLRTDLRSPQEVKASIKRLEEENLGRKLLYGVGTKRPALIVCRWVQGTSADNPSIEYPPSENCQPDLLDVAIQSNDPINFDVTQYQKLFDGNIDRLHICRSCNPHVVISTIGTNPHTEVKSLWGLLVLSLIQFSTHSNQTFLIALDDRQQTQSAIGSVRLYLQGLTHPIEIQKLRTTFALIINIAGLCLLATWLAIRAHRKVLDYFAYSGALSPLVAATGTHSFYAAIWILTGARVVAFLFASVPIVLFGLWELLNHQTLLEVWEHKRLLLLIWIPSLMLSFAAASLVASVAELKQRHEVLSFTYRYVPLLMATLGFAIWAASFIFDSETAALLRSVLISTPILGMAPLLLSPVIPAPLWTLCTHAGLTIVILSIIMRHNARWFAAHIEEL
jgi:hypothetical protein